jgi:methylenetetrahydrofolate dehydrogenase (NADP+)/methenyltetrahydrofolate cyclohydrolase
MATIFDGKEKAEKLNRQTASEINDLNLEPSLAIIRTLNTEGQIRFTNMKKEIAAQLGIKCEIVDITEEPSNERLIALIQKHSQNFKGILVQLPLHNNLEKITILNSIPYKNDVEGFSKCRIGESIQTIPSIYSPVAMAIVDALKKALEDTSLTPKGLKATLVGDSYMIGRPLVQILNHMGLTVTLTNQYTQNLKSQTLDSDIVISGVGKAGLVTTDMVKDGVIAIDAGVSIDQEGKVYGDIAPTVQSKASFFTPPTGGIGPLTIAYIFRNLLKL